MELEHLLCSLFRSLRMSLLSLSWTTRGLQQRPVVLDEVAVLSSVVVVAAAGMPVAAGAPFSVWAVEEEVRDKIAITTTVVAEVVEGEDSGGKTMISLSGIEIRVSISSRNGRCLRRLTSTVWPS